MEFWTNQQLIGSKKEKEKSEGDGFMNGFQGLVTYSILINSFNLFLRAHSNKSGQRKPQ